MNQTLVCTIGHSSRTLEGFAELLAHHEIERVIDVRTVPRSRHNPQFDRSTLPASLRHAGVGYTHVPELGGLRHPRPDSPNTGWRNLSFRGYADHMQSPEFAQGIEVVESLAREGRCALMCAEAVPWRCHRSLIGDALLVRGVRVEDIIGPGPRRVHELTPFAHVDGLRITYPAEPSRQATLDYDGTRGE